jgi:hypothetical protein
MHPIFEITSSDIQKLSDKQARELIARLCKAELRAKGVGTNAVTWGGDQRAPDGGVDVIVDIKPPVGISGYIPKDVTVYQVKAEKFSPKKIHSEMAPEGALRPAITELSEQSGAYVIVSTKDDLSPKSLKNRNTAMSSYLDGHGLAGKVHTDFYAVQKIADWSENFPVVVVWLKNILGKPLEGWSPYGPWTNHKESIEDEYLLDDKVKVFTPTNDEGIPVTEAINRLRGELSKDRASVRIVGLSGVGKTRLVQALFDNRIDTSNQVLNHESVLYTDLSNNPTPQPIGMIEALIQDGADSVVVVDNCGQDIHQRLTEIVKRPNSSVRLVTVEYDIRDDLPEDTTCYRLEGSSDQVIAGLLKRRFQTLSDLDINKIVEFSDGNARVAFALASTSETKSQLAQLIDDELFQRLFVQKHSSSEDLQRCAEVASLLYSFDAEDISETSELNILSSVSGVTVTLFLRNVAELQQRGLVQKRGKWRAILPHAIANRLAMRAVEAYPPQFIVKKFVFEASERVARSFSRRLGYLHESQCVRNIADEWLSPGGLLGDVTELNEFRRQMLENIAPINQHAALDSLLRAVECKDFISISNRNRAHYAQLLRSLAYESDLFDDAAMALLKFALEEPDDYKADSVRGILKSVFYARLSGTLSPPKQRATFVRTLAFSGEEAKQKLALTLLEASLESHFFTSPYNFDFGALRRSYGWYPESVQERYEWYSLFVSIVVDLGKTPTVIGSDARSLLGREFRGLWTNIRLYDVLAKATTELAAIDGWPDGWIGIRNTLHWDKKELDSSSLEALKALDQKLAPRDLLVKIQAEVLSRGPFGADLEDAGEPEPESKSAVAWYDRAREKAEILGKEAAHDEKALVNLVPYLSREKSTDKSWYFGSGVGQAAISPGDILDRAKQVLSTLGTNEVNSLFIQGIVAGWNKQKPLEAAEFLDRALADDIWGGMFPELQMEAGLDDAAHNRLMKCLEMGKTPVWRFNCLGIGRATGLLSLEQIASILSTLARKPEGGTAVAIDVLCRIIHCIDNKCPEYRSELQAYCSRFISEIDWKLINLDDNKFLYHLETVITFALAGGSPHNEAIEAMRNLILFVKSSSKHIPLNLGKTLLPFFKEYPSEALNACYVQDKNDSYDTTLRMLSIFPEESGETAVSAVTENELIIWCNSSPNDRFIFAAQTCKLLEQSKSNGQTISSTAKTVLKHAPDKKVVLGLLIDRLVYCSRSYSTKRERLPLLDQLNCDNEQELQAIIDNAKERISNIIAMEEQQRLEWERSRIASFE